MIGWILIGGVAYLFNALWAFAAALGIVIFFPRLARFSFAFIAFPIYTTIFATWLFIPAWLFGFCSFSTSAWANCFWITSIPVGLFLSFTGNAAINELSQQ